MKIKMGRTCWRDIFRPTSDYPHIQRYIKSRFGSDHELFWNVRRRLYEVAKFLPYQVSPKPFVVHTFCWPDGRRKMPNERDLRGLGVQSVKEYERNVIDAEYEEKRRQEKIAAEESRDAAKELERMSKRHATDPKKQGERFVKSVGKG